MNKDITDILCDEAAVLLDEKIKSLGRKLNYREYERIEEDVLHSWFENERLDDVMEYVLFNFDTNGGNDLRKFLSHELVEERNAKKLHKLFRGLIPGRMNAFWTQLSSPSKGSIGNITFASSAKAETLEVMLEYYNAMLELGEEDAASKIKEEMLQFNSEEKKKPSKPDPRKIDNCLFWELINISSTNASSASEFISNLETELTKFKATEIKNFQKLLITYQHNLDSWDLWAFAYIAKGGCSDDSFDYFKNWIISQGQETYKISCENFDKLIDVFEPCWGLECEELSYVADAAYYNRQGKPMPSISIPVSKIKGEPWEEDELKNKYSRIWNEFS